MIDAPTEKKVIIFGSGFAWFLIIGNLIFFLALLNVLPIYNSMRGKEFDIIDYLRAGIYLIDAIAAIFILFGRPVVTTITFIITSTISFGLSEWLSQASAGKLIVYAVLSFILAYWDIFALVWITKKQQRLQKLFDHDRFIS